MCEFHSFLYDCYTGRIFDALGETSHATIAEKVGVNQDEFLLPEFHLGERRLDFDGASLNDMVSKAPHKTGFFLKNQMRFSQRAPWNQQALDRLARYLKRRFGTPERLVDFVEPQWDVAEPHCARLLSARAVPRQQATKIIVSPQEVTIALQATPIPIMATFPVNIPAPQKVEIAMIGLSQQQIDALCECYSNHKICSLQFTGPAMGELNNYRVPPMVITSLASPSSAADLKLKGIIVQEVLEIDFDDWKKLFLKARENRIEAWQRDPVDMLV